MPNIQVWKDVTIRHWHNKLAGFALLLLALALFICPELHTNCLHTTRLSRSGTATLCINHLDLKTDLDLGDYCLNRNACQVNQREQGSPRWKNRKVLLTLMGGAQTGLFPPAELRDKVPCPDKTQGSQSEICPPVPTQSPPGRGPLG
jgi:hypothetical protein